MKYYTVYKKQLDKNIHKLSTERKMDFAIEACETLFPEYEKFEAVYNWGNSKVLEDGINYCNNNRTLENIDAQKIEMLIEEIDEVIPHMDDFGSLQGSFAMNAGVVLLSTLKFMLERQDHYISTIGSYMHDTIDFKVRSQNEDLDEEDIENHPMILHEISRQIEKTS